MENEYDVKDTPYQIMEHSCEYFGSSLGGRLSGTKSMLGSIYKSPILVEESKNIIFFPTKSPNIEDNAWISLNNIKDFKKNGKSTKVIFKNDQEVDINVPFLSFENQVLRATRLEAIFRQRRYEKND